VAAAARRWKIMVRLGLYALFNFKINKYNKQIKGIML
jgi:hypothetical protein